MRFIREYFSVIFGLLIIALIPGCGPKQNSSSKAAPPKKQAAFSFDSLETNIDIAAGAADRTLCNPEIEAKLQDIPTMVGSIPIELYNAQLPERQMMLAWACQYDQEMVTNFYNFEMENAGWKRIACIKGYENTLVFQKPKRICIISIRTLSSKLKNQYAALVHMCVCNKE
jgi:hypothetical protein